MRLQPEDPSALYQQGLHVHRIAQTRPSLKLTPPEMAMKLQALTGATFSEEDLDVVPITEEPWKRLEFHGKVYKSISDIVSAMEAPIEHFLAQATGRKAMLRRGRYEGTLNAELMSDTLQPVMDEWRSVTGAFQSASQEYVRLDLFDEDVLDSFGRVAKELEDFTAKIDWFVTSSLRRAPHWGTLGADVLPAQLQVEQSIIDEFSEQKDKTLQTIREIIEEFIEDLAADAREPFKYLGNGTCVDSSSRRYSSFEAPGCETRIACIKGCRQFRVDECRGVTWHDEDGCGRCELRMEANYSHAKGAWHAAWTGGTGQGEVGTTAVAAFPDTRCYKRVLPEWYAWPKNIQKFIEEDIMQLHHNFEKVSRLSDALLFKLDRAFWQVESGFALAAPAITTSEWS